MSVSGIEQRRREVVREGIIRHQEGSRCEGCERDLIRISEAVRSDGIDLVLDAGSLPRKGAALALLEDRCCRSEEGEERKQHGCSREIHVDEGGWYEVKRMATRETRLTSWTWKC